MTSSLLTRQQILGALERALEPLDYVHAMWQGGAAAFGRVDEWSDIDLQVDVDDDRVADTFTVIEETLAGLSPIELRNEIPQPSWHGHAQVFYRLRDASPYLMLDIVVIQGSNPNKFLQPEIHGRPVVQFDKSGVVRFQPLDRGAFVAALQARLEVLRRTFDLYRTLTLKELNRGNAIEAFSFYQGFTLRPLVEVLRIRYAPFRYNFHARYLYYDLPPDVVARLEHLFFVSDGESLRVRHREAEEWFNEVSQGIDFDMVRGTMEGEE